MTAPSPYTCKVCMWEERVFDLLVGSRLVVLAGPRVFEMALFFWGRPARMGWSGSALWREQAGGACMCMCMCVCVCGRVRIPVCMHASARNSACVHNACVCARAFHPWPNPPLPPAPPLPSQVPCSRLPRRATWMTGRRTCLCTTLRAAWCRDTGGNDGARATCLGALARLAVHRCHRVHRGLGRSWQDVFTCKRMPVLELGVF